MKFSNCFILSLFISFFQFSITGKAQDFYNEGRRHVDTLTKPHFWGRGYINSGVENAADYIYSYYKDYRVKSFGATYFQDFHIRSVNVFTDSVKLVIDGKELIAGRDFIVSGNSQSCSIQNIPLIQKDSVTYVSKDKKIVIELKDKLTFAPSQSRSEYTLFQVVKDLDLQYKHVSANVETKKLQNYPTKNVIGFIPGKLVQDSFLVLTAHYDHIGGYGTQLYFPGANDNASGVAMLLALMKYYTENPPDYSIVFMAFSGEEIGLLGSFYYVENSLFELGRIKFLINLDLVGNGSDGITIVNAKEFPEYFNLLKNLLLQRNYFNQFIDRAQAANSDHYPFFEKGVPCFFIYSNGGHPAYHDIYDVSENLQLEKFNEISNTVIAFYEILMNRKK